jgi:hypothetical protein
MQNIWPEGHIGPKDCIIRTQKHEMVFFKKELTLYTFNFQTEVFFLTCFTKIRFAFITSRKEEKKIKEETNKEGRGEEKATEVIRKDKTDTKNNPSKNKSGGSHTKCVNKSSAHYLCIQLHCLVSSLSTGHIQMPPAGLARFHDPSSSLSAHVHKPGGKCPAGNKR